MKVCLVCGKDISNRHRMTKYCFECANIRGNKSRQLKKKLAEEEAKNGY